MRTPLMPPAVQYERSCATSKYTVIACVTAPNTAPIAVPASARNTGPRPAPLACARKKMASVASPAPAIEKSSDTLRLPCGKRIIKTASPNPAPALMPRMDGLAIGLFVTPCISAPATAKLAPQRSAARRRGRRSVRTIISCTFAGSYAVNDRKIVATDTSCAPI